MNSSRQQWLEWRNAGIGGSDAPIVMKVSPWTTRDKLLLLKTGQATPPPPSFVMRRGLKMEPDARAAYEHMTGIAMPPAHLVKEDQPFIRGSFDGLNHDARRALEIKCPGRADHLLASKGQIPAKYIWQCVHLLLVSGLNRIDYFSFNPECGGGIIIPFKRSPRLEKTLIEEETLFWKEVQKILKAKELPMKQPQSQFYTAKEVVEILQKARACGAISLKLPGYEATFNVQTEVTEHELTETEKQARENRAENVGKSPFKTATDADRGKKPQKKSPEKAEEDAHSCETCGSQNLDDWMTHCFRCYRNLQNGG